MLVGNHNLSRRTKTLRPAQSLQSLNSGTNSNNSLDELANGGNTKDEVPEDTIFPFLKNLPPPKVKKFTKYSVTGIKELPRSSGLQNDDNTVSDVENGESSDVENNNCSLSSQLGTKERELQLAIQKQERYQSTVQDVTARMERVQQKLASLGTSPFKNLDQQIKDQKVGL
jgi:hypothetical protein